MSFGGSGGGSGNIHTDGDVALNNPTDGQVLTYSSSVGKWQNATVTGSGAVTIPNLPTAVPVTVSESSGSYPARPAFTGAVWWIGPDVPASGGTTGGGAGAVSGLDLWFKTVS